MEIRPTPTAYAPAFELAEGRSPFSGGFLGLDDIGVFDRLRPLPTGGHLEQADGTAWMAFYSATMLAMALDDGHGVGASHQTGWTATVLRLLEKVAKERTNAQERR